MLSKDWPAWFFDPADPASGKIFASWSEVPEGWATHAVISEPRPVEAAPPAAPAKTPSSRADYAALLDHMGVCYPSDATLQYLRRAYAEAVALTGKA